MKTKTKIKLSQTLLLSFLLIGAAHAAEEALNDNVRDKEKEDGKPPIGCRVEGFKFELDALHLMTGSNGNNLSLYLLFNDSSQTLSLYQMRGEESSRSMFLNHAIGGHEWGILSTGEKLVKFICTIPNKKSAYGQVVDCGQFLKVCEYTNVRYGLNNRGNFWLVNSSTRNGAVSSVVHYGIIPGN